MQGWIVVEDKRGENKKNGGLDRDLKGREMKMIRVEWKCVGR